MNINWKVRIKNPVFWVFLVSTIFINLLAQFGMSVNDISTWSALFDLLINAFKNPIVLAGVVSSCFSAIIDPTTSGVSDSKTALSYKEPRKE
ncbi:MAG: phage holin [Ruminococcus sp.]|nr:phage holin [Ruminococcus sp.]